MKTSTTTLRTIALATFALCTALAAASALAAPAAAGMAPATALNTLYWQGHQALGDGEWDLAAQRFDDLEQRLRRSEPDAVDAAIYWRAYALARAGRGPQARAAVAQLQREFPRSRWNRDAADLLLSGARAGAAVNGGTGTSAELEALLVQPPAQAIPRLLALMEAPSSTPQLKKRALFVLSQMDDPGALLQMTAIARGRDPLLRAEAVRLLAQAGLNERVDDRVVTPEVARKREVVDAMHVAGADRAQVLLARNGVDAVQRRTAIQALGRAKSFEALADIAATHADPGTRADAIRALGQAGARERLRMLYPAFDASPVLRDEVLHALQVAGDVQGLRAIDSAARTQDERDAVRRALARSGASAARDH